MKRGFLSIFETSVAFVLHSQSEKWKEKQFNSHVEHVRHICIHTLLNLAFLPDNVH